MNTSRLTVQKLLRLPFGGNGIDVESERGVTRHVSLAEFAALDGLAAELALIDGLTANAGEINRFCDLSTRVVTVVASGAITEGANEGKVNLLGEVGGNAKVELVLPAATGSGGRYRFKVSVVNTSNYEIRVADAATILVGSIQGSTALDNTVLGWECGAADDTVILNGGTTGGLSIGDWIEFIDILASRWAVRGQLTHADVAATPFSATVS